MLPTIGGASFAIDALHYVQHILRADEPKKEIIIHNQGTPMIFQFGHERRWVVVSLARRVIWKVISHQFNSVLIESNSLESAVMRAAVANNNLIVKFWDMIEFHQVSKWIASLRGQALYTIVKTDAIKAV